MYDAILSAIFFNLVDGFLSMGTAVLRAENGRRGTAVVAADPAPRQAAKWT
jgi:hypothetical protein